MEDFTRYVIPKRGYVYFELLVDPKTKYKIFYRSYTPENPLPPGTSVHLIDVETNLETPVTIPKGYYSEFIEWAFYTNVELYLKMYLDGVYMGAFYIPGNATVHEYEAIVWSSTKFKDPGATEDHTWDFILENPTTTSAICFVHTALRVIKVSSSEYPRKVRCPSCNHVFETRKDATRHKCPMCNTQFTTFLFGWWEG